MNKSSPLFFFTLLILVIGCFYAQPTAGNKCPQITTPNVDVPRYLGVWYEISSSAAIRETFERNCLCTNAQYTLSNTTEGALVVNNECRKKNVTNPWQVAIGQATVPNLNETGKLQVTFGASPPAPYWIILVDQVSYSWAVVWSCESFFGIEGYTLWILSRTPTMEQSLYDELTAQASKLTGIDAQKELIPTVQGPQCNYNR
mmetsp:Transcript_713/g.965  ORF Transcript_713/g.965 Transcript_713/m.965 type:complete len:202 (+) Transcript_713:54-659(+)